MLRIFSYFSSFLWTFVNKEGWKEDILYILVTLFSTWKHDFFFQTSNLPLTFQNKWFFFFMGIFNLPLVFKGNLCHIIWTWKNTPKVSPFFRVGINFSYNEKKNWLTQKHILKCSPHQYWGARKKNQILIGFGKVIYLFYPVKG
jgi:hypothetical protein